MTTLLLAAVLLLTQAAAPATRPAAVQAADDRPTGRWLDGSGEAGDAREVTITLRQTTKVGGASGGDEAEVRDAVVFEVQGVRRVLLATASGRPAQYALEVRRATASVAGGRTEPFLLPGTTVYVSWGAADEGRAWGRPRGGVGPQYLIDGRRVTRPMRRLLGSMLPLEDPAGAGTGALFGVAADEALVAGQRRAADADELARRLADEGLDVRAGTGGGELNVHAADGGRLVAEAAWWADGLARRDQTGRRAWWQRWEVAADGTRRVERVTLRSADGVVAGDDGDDGDNGRGRPLHERLHLTLEVAAPE